MSRMDYLLTEMRVIVTYVRLLILPVDQNLDYDYPVYTSLFHLPVFFSFLFLAAIFSGAVYLLYKSRQRAKSREQSGTLSSFPQAEREESLRPPEKEDLRASAEVYLPVAGATRSGMTEFNPTPHALYPVHYAYYRLIAFGILWFFIALSVESSFIPIVDVIFEHRLYLPSVGAFLALSSAIFAGMEAFQKRRPKIDKVMFPVILLLIGILTAATFARNRTWQDEVDLWNDVVKKSPGKPRAHYNLGLALQERGALERAIEEYQITLKLDPSDTASHNNLGNIYSHQGQSEDALSHYQAALKIEPGSSIAHYNLANEYLNQGRLDEALDHYNLALEIYPDSAEVYNNLGGLYFRLGRMDEALKAVENALKIDPDYSDARRNFEVISGKAFR